MRPEQFLIIAEQMTAKSILIKHKFLLHLDVIKKLGYFLRGSLEIHLKLTHYPTVKFKSLPFSSYFPFAFL